MVGFWKINGKDSTKQFCEYTLFPRYAAIKINTCYINFINMNGFYMAF